MVVRDADAPDVPVDGASVIVLAPGGKRPQAGSPTNEKGLTVSLKLDTAHVTVLIRRIGYTEARFALTLRPACEQVLEVYIAQALVMFDRCQVVTSSSPPCYPDPPRTPSRAVFTTCAPAA